MDPRADRLRAELRAARVRVALRVAHLAERRRSQAAATPAGLVLLAAAVLLAVAFVCAVVERR